jgi:sRNA-binding regulator protein Hfq
MDFGPGSGNEHPVHIPNHVQELIKFRDERKPLVFTLTNGEKLEGAVRWFDDAAIHIVTPERDEMTLFRHAILYYRPV